MRKAVNKQANKSSGSEPEPSKCPQRSRQAVRTRISSRRGTHVRGLSNASWECPPSRGRATNAREKESPLAILRPEDRGPASYSGLGVRGTPKQRGLEEPRVGSDLSNGLQENRLVPTVSDGPIEVPGDIQTRFMRPIQICLPHRQHSECDGEPGLDPIPHSGYTRSVD
ncbi:hypothetical protein CRG98_019840 [Punica granatum]|uniref:Uncharacterized protein n=1 Tax=Punica granatum TaxID=22663 RepID=A0A2I0JWC9_PUNGR|nr:hypothetical protein CRG98_019840 [Punica granatum]